MDEIAAAETLAELQTRYAELVVGYLRDEVEVVDLAPVDLLDALASLGALVIPAPAGDNPASRAYLEAIAAIEGE